MFNYRLPKWNRQINIKRMSIFMTALYILTVLPLLIISFYNWPSADDMSLALKTYRYFNETGNIFGTFFYAFKVGFDEYMTWMGYFFSNVVFCYSPSIFGEKWYFLTAFIMIGILTLGVCYFFKALFVYGLKRNKSEANIISMLTLMIITQSMPKGTVRVEAFYWYSGAINYMFMFGMGLFWLGLIIRSVYDDSAKKRFRKLLWACFWGFWLGGANYMTALEIAICSFLIITIFVLSKTSLLNVEALDDDKKKSFNKIWIPTLINLIGFMLSCFAPGNATREAIVEGFGPVKAVLISLYYTFDLCVNEFTRWEVIVAFILLIPISWKVSENIKHKFEHPFIFTVFAYGMVSSNIVPPIYAIGNIEAGRLKSIIWAEYVVMVVLVVFYITAWVRQLFESEAINLSAKPVDCENFSAEAAFAILTIAVLLVFGSGLSVKTDPMYYSGTSAIYDVVTGNAKAFLSENEKRLKILQDDSVTDCVFEPYSVEPELLFFYDISTDKENWINKAMARYYGKNSVVLK